LTEGNFRVRRSRKALSTKCNIGRPPGTELGRFFQSFAQSIDPPDELGLIDRKTILFRASRPDRTEHRIHSEERNRVSWRSTPRYAAAAKRKWERDIVRLLMLRK
jgi:hypothetical protein